MRFIKKFGVALAFAGGIFTPAAYADNWIKAETQHFVIYSDANVKATRDYASKLENFYLVTDAFYDKMSPSVLPTYQKTRLNYFNRVSEFRIVRPELESNQFNPYLTCTEGTQYFSTAEAQNNNTLYGEGPLDKDIDLNLAYMFFAYNSQVLHERFGELPSWVSTGLNWYFMTAVFKDGNILIGKPPPNIAMSMSNYGIDNLASSRNFIPYADLIADKPITRDKADMEALQDWVMVSYLMSDPVRRQTFFEYLHLIAEGMDSPTAYKKAIAMPPESFREVMKTYTDKGVSYQSYKVGPLPDAAVTIANLPPYGSAVPLMDAALQTCPKKAYGQKLLTDIKKIALTFPDDTLSQTALARAEIRFGSPDIALPYLTKRLAADTKDIDAQFLMGRLYLALAERGTAENRTQNYANARHELGKAYQLNPSSAPLLYFYARAFADRPDYPDENTMNAVSLAQDYSGGWYDMYEAQLELRQGDYEAAQTLIDKRLTFATKDWSKDKRTTLTAIRDELIARKAQADILPLFAHYEEIED